MSSLHLEILHGHAQSALGYLHKLPQHELDTNLHFHVASSMLRAGYEALQKQWDNDSPELALTRCEGLVNSALTELRDLFPGEPHIKVAIERAILNLKLCLNRKDGGA